MTTGAKSAYKTQIQISDGASPPVYTTIAEVKDIQGPSITVDTIDVTSHDSVDGFREFVAGMIDGAEVTLDCNLIADATQLDRLDGLMDRDPADNIRAYRIVFPDDSDTKTATVSGTTWTATAHGFRTAHPVRFSTSGALPAAVIAGKWYFARRINADTFSIHLTAAAAVANTGAINSATAGTGTHTVKSGTRFEFSASTTGFEPGSPADGAHSVSITLKVTGVVTVTP